MKTDVALEAVTLLGIGFLASIVPRLGGPTAMMRTKSVYDESFYESLRQESVNSASVVLPLLNDVIQPRTCVDVGCGIGTWLSVAQQIWATEIVGIDGEYVDSEKLLIPRESFRAHDLTAPLHLTDKFDLALCLEVIEHLPADRGSSLVRDLCSLSDVVLFSAAIPGQGGTDHINEQWSSVWVGEFENNGFRCFDIVRPFVWLDERVASYYRQNVFVAVRGSNQELIRAASERSAQAPTIWDVAHPTRWVRQVQGPIQLRRVPRLAARSLGAAVRRRVVRPVRR